MIKYLREKGTQTVIGLCLRKIAYNRNFYGPWGESRVLVEPEGTINISGLLHPLKGSMPVLQRQLLLVTNDLALSQLIQAHMENSTTKVSCMASLSKAVAHIVKIPYCLLIIDFQVSDLDNIEMIRIFRAAKHLPILALTNALTVQEKTALFHAGVTAFLDKPVDVDLCVAQVNALIKPYQESNEGSGRSVPVTFGSSLVIVPRYRQVLVQGAPIELTRIEFNLFYFMAKHPMQVFSRQELYDHVWDNYFELGGDETVKSHIKALRKKFTGLGHDIIETVWAVGYRFVPPE